MKYIAILCATYGHHMLLLLPFALFPLLLLSFISSNDRYRHSLSSLDNNKTGIYLSTSPRGCCQRRTDS